MLSEAEKRRYEDIVTIQRLLAEGYAPTRIVDMLHTTYHRVRRYARGDPLKMCRFGTGINSLDAYWVEIERLLRSNVNKKDAFEQIKQLGYTGKRTAFGQYCRKMIKELGINHTPRINNAGVSIQPKENKPQTEYVTKKDLMEHLWMGREIEQHNLAYILKKYPNVSLIRNCIDDFRQMIRSKDTAKVDGFIVEYSKSDIKDIRSFASGLLTDEDAVKNAVTRNESNGFVEGHNNKIKMIKRTMYGRAGLGLLRVKILHAS